MIPFVFLRSLNKKVDRFSLEREICHLGKCKDFTEEVIADSKRNSLGEDV